VVHNHEVGSSSLPLATKESLSDEIRGAFFILDIESLLSKGENGKKTIL
jgi:hypothetical protein